MHLTDGSGHVNNAFVEEDVGAGRPASQVTADWLNAVQSEIASVILEDGQALSKADSQQLAKAVVSLITKASSAHTSASDPHPQYLQSAQVQALIEARVGDYVIGAGTSNAATCTLNPPITAYTSQTSFSVKLAATNTGPVTLDAGGGPRSIKRDDGTDMQAGDLQAGMVVTVVYDASTDSFYATTMVSSQAQALQSAQYQVSYFMGQI